MHTFLSVFKAGIASYFAFKVVEPATSGFPNPSVPLGRLVAGSGAIGGEAIGGDAIGGSANGSGAKEGNDIGCGAIQAAPSNSAPSNAAPCEPAPLPPPKPVGIDSERKGQCNFRRSPAE